MIRSMTGFGRGESAEGGRRAEVTIRTLNHRYLSVRPRALSEWPLLQLRLEEVVKRAFHRGEIDVWVALEPARTGSAPPSIDRERVGRRLAELRAITEEFRLPVPPSLSDLIQIGALASVPESEEEIWRLVEPALGQAIAGALRGREEEGALLAAELEGILDNLSALVSRVKERIPALREELRARLRERVAELSLEVDPSRLETEVVLLADRSDVEEEMTRLEAHLAHARRLLAAEGAVGRELDFLSQELLRETNTLGSKSRDLATSSIVLEMKVEIERFKEQVQNVE